MNSRFLANLFTVLSIGLPIKAMALFTTVPGSVAAKLAQPTEYVICGKSNPKYEELVQRSILDWTNIPGANPPISYGGVVSDPSECTRSEPGTARIAIYFNVKPGQYECAGPVDTDSFCNEGSNGRIFILPLRGPLKYGRNILTHEIGHSLGLMHLGQQPIPGLDEGNLGGVMGTISKTNRRRMYPGLATLGSFDVAHLRFRYPAPVDQRDPRFCLADLDPEVTLMTSSLPDVTSTDQVSVINMRVRSQMPSWCSEKLSHSIKFLIGLPYTNRRGDPLYKKAGIKFELSEKEVWLAGGESTIVSATVRFTKKITGIIAADFLVHNPVQDDPYEVFLPTYYAGMSFRAAIAQ